MSKRLIKIALVLVLVVLVFQVAAVLAADATTLENPLGTINDPRIIIGNVIKALLGIVGSLALLIFIFGGFTWVTSAGSDEKIKKGKDMITWAAFGLIVIFISYALVNFVVGAITGGGQDQATGEMTVPQGSLPLP